VRPSDRDLDHCHALLARGSKSFSFAARFLPPRLADPVAALYAFCRVSDDLVDDSSSPREALAALAARLDRAYADRPDDDPVDRALAWLAIDHRLPRAPLEALLEGYLWDVEERTYETLSDVIAYGVRVAGSVGVAMSWLMDRRAPHVLARACDLGVAMQLTNIARDVGEDARRGRLYLPAQWLGLDPRARTAFLAAPTPTPWVRDATRRLLDHADVLYLRADAGLSALPGEVRPAIRIARTLYAAIGDEIRLRGYDTVSGRAHTRTRRKLALGLEALLIEGRTRLEIAEFAPNSARETPPSWPPHARPPSAHLGALHAPPLSEAAWLCAAGDP